MDFPHALFRHRGLPRVTSNVPVTLTESRSLITYARETPAQRWDLEVSGIVLPTDTNEFNAFYVPLKGSTVTFNYCIPVFGGSQSPNVQTTASATAGATSVTVDSTLMIGKGDYFNFAGHGKLYMVQDVSGNEVAFFPRLVSSVTTAEAVNFTNPTVTVRMRNAQRFESESRHHPTTYSLDLNEVL